MRLGVLAPYLKSFLNMGDKLRLGTAYGGWTIPKNLLTEHSVRYCVGCGENISFDLALAEKYSCEGFGFDPTRRSIAYAGKVTSGIRNYHFQDVGIWQGWFFVPINLVLADPAQQPGEAARRGVWHACDTTRDPRVFLSIGELRHLSQRHIIGCHTANHVRLTDKLTEEELDHEIVGAKGQLESVLGQAIDSFAWVFGDEWAYSRGAAERIAGSFTYSFTTNTRITQPHTPCLQIDRTHLEADFSHPLTHFQVSGLMDLYYASKRRRLKPCLAASVRLQD
jgi:hypothetical protein